MTTLVTGGAGFIGSCVVETLASKGEQVVVVDNLSTGRLALIEHLLDRNKCTFLEGDILDTGMVEDAMRGVDTVWHLAANPDIRLAEKDTGIDIKQGIMGTHSVLEAMTRTGVRKLVFSSSSVVYGEAVVIPTPEDYGPLMPISMYGAAKLAAEGLITAYCHSQNIHARIYRFANIVGTNQTHGVVYDFLGKLGKNPGRLEVLGNGKQAKSYLLVEDCVNAMRHMEKHGGPVEIYNLGGTGRTPVSRIAEMVRDAKSPNAEIVYTGGERGWTGDVRQMELSIDKALSTGWKPTVTSDGAIKESIKLLL